MSADLTSASALPRFRLFSATWSEFTQESQLPALPQTANGAVGLANTLRWMDMLADEAIHLHDQDGISCITALEAFLALPGEQVIVYLASHGLAAAGPNQFFRLATGDTRQPGDLTRSLPLVEIVSRLFNSEAERKLLIVDACYSGQAAGSMLLPNGGDDWANPRSACVLASSSPYQSSLAPADKPLTSFTASLVSLLEQGLPTQEPAISMSTLFKQLREHSRARELPEPWISDQGVSAESILFRNQAAVDIDPSVYRENIAQFDHRAEILYVDDEAEYRETFAAELEAAGHRVTLASGPLDAVEALANGHFDIVVLDLLLVGDTPACDVIHACASKAADSMVFLVSRRSMGTKEIWERLDAIFPYPNHVSAFLWKPDYVEVIVAHADMLREQRRQILSHVETLEEAVPLVAGRIIKRDSALLSYSERLQLQVRICVEKLVSKWFEHEDGFIESMTLTPAGSGRSITSVFKLVPRLRSIDPGGVMPLVLKIGPRAEIGEEVARYDRFVQVGVPLDLRTDKIGSAFVGQVGGVIYSFRGSRDAIVHEVAQLDPADIAECLDVVFDPTQGKKWFASTAARKIRPLEHYAQLGYPLERFKEAAEALAKSLPELVEHGADCDGYAHSIVDAFEAPAMSRQHAATLVHGDLNLGNLLRSGPKRFALIDYRTVGVGPRLVDFATLEVGCWMLAPAPDESRRKLFADARQAVAEEFDDERSESDIPSWIGPYWSLAMRCRRLALENFPDASPAEYASLLWLAAVRRSEFKSSAPSAQERRTLRVLSPALALAAKAMLTRGPAA